MGKLEIRCAWCGKTMGEKEGEGLEGTTDGICDDCLLYHFPHIHELVKRQEEKGDEAANERYRAMRLIYFLAAILMGLVILFLCY